MGSRWRSCRGGVVANTTFEREGSTSWRGQTGELPHAFYEIGNLQSGQPDVTGTLPGLVLPSYGDTEGTSERLSGTSSDRGLT